MSFWISLAPQIKIFLLAMLPIIEVRGAIPLGLTVYDQSIITTFIFGAAGNFIAAAIVFLGLHMFGDKVIEKIPKIGPMLEKYLARARRIFKGKYEHWGVLGLILFVGIPLPMTGGWTGAAAAYVFGFPKKKSLAALAAGVLLASTVMTLLTTGIEWIIRLF